MLTIKQLAVSVEGKPILHGIDLVVKPGEIHAIMGPNGSGKTTLANVLAGNENYQVTAGTIQFNGEDLLPLSPEERAVRGVFLAFQYPIAIPGVNNMYFLRTALNSLRKQRGEKELDAFDFMQMIKGYREILAMDESFMHRFVNDGFSGGEKKRNEVLQMLTLQPKLAILDETDSGLDIDALQVVAQGVNQLRDKDRSFIVVTHYQRLLDFIVPDVVHVLANGRIIKSGDKSLALALEKNGYGWIENEA